MAKNNRYSRQTPVGLIRNHNGSYSLQREIKNFKLEPSGRAKVKTDNMSQDEYKRYHELLEEYFKDFGGLFVNKVIADCIIRGLGMEGAKRELESKRREMIQEDYNEID